MIGTRTAILMTLFCIVSMPQWSHACPSPNDAFRDIRKVATEHGIEQQEIVNIGGVPQWISIRARDRSAPRTLADARAERNTEAISQLEAIAPFPDATHPERNLQNLAVERRWLAHYGGYFKAGGAGQHNAVAQLSPTYTAADLQARQEAHDFILQSMWGELGGVDLNNDIRFDVPVIIMQGRHDRGTSSVLVKEWHDALKVPYKKLIWFEESSHMVYEEEPGKLLVALVNEVLPLARPR